MAIDSDLPSVEPTSIVSASSSSSTSSSLSPPSNQRTRLIQVATTNSATFIQFPTNTRQASLFVPVCRPRTSHSTTRLFSCNTDTQSVSNQSKFSANTPSVSNDNKRGHSHQRINPILNNPLLNHRKEQPKSPSNENSRPTRLCHSSRPLKPISNDIQTPAIRASTAPILAHQKETNIDISDRLIISTENKTPEHQMQYVTDNKYDYITRWLTEVRAATYSKETSLSKSKRTKRRLTTS